ncbi:MAG: hypothetical protein HY329_06320 [Chloroflexi bacterium]|nr:hypothetical protein [Chloroflexota bacterium]
MTLSTTPVADRLFVASATLQRFVAAVPAARPRRAEPTARLAALWPHFEALLGDRDWLPGWSREAVAGLAGSEWSLELLYRDDVTGLVLAALLLPPGVRAPIAEPRSAGLVGVGLGDVRWDVLVRRDDGAHQGFAVLDLVERRVLPVGACDELGSDRAGHRFQALAPAGAVVLLLLADGSDLTWRTATGAPLGVAGLGPAATSAPDLYFTAAGRLNDQLHPR